MLTGEPVRWQWAHHSADGVLEFNTEINVTGEITPQTQLNVLCRLFAWHVLSKLADGSLVEVCEYLSETYAMQLERQKLAAEAPAPKYLWTSTLKTKDPNTPLSY